MLLRPLAALAALAAPLAISAAVVPAAAAPDTVEIANVAHRGASAYAPENTIAAVEAGIAMKSDLIEVDVQRSKDGVLVMMHDTTLARTTNVEEVFPDRAPWRVSDFTYEEMLQLDAGSWKSPEYAGERIPTLAEVIEAIRPSRAGLLLEVKAPASYPGIEAHIVEEMRRFPGYVQSAVAADRLVVQSFDWESMRIYNSLEPSVPAGLLDTPAPALFAELATWADQINPNHRTIDQAYVDAVHAHGMEVYTWTIDQPADMERVIDFRVDGVITNRPDVLEQVLRSDLGRAA